MTAPAPTTLPGPVSAALEADLRATVRRHGVVVWLDLDGHYTGFVDRLVDARTAGQLPYQVRALRGSHLALMLALEGIAGGTEKVPFVLHLPGFNEDTVKDTPLLELYAAGIRYRKALETLVTEAAAGRVRPEQIEAFKAQPGLTLATADAWLAGMLADSEGGFIAQLRALQPTGVLDDLLGGTGWVSKSIGQPGEAAELWRSFATWLGLTETWRDVALPASARNPRDMAFAAASWALGVEYVDDLRRPPVNTHLQGMRALPRAVIDTCRGLAAHLRDRHREFYQRTADEIEALIADEVAAARAEDLGQVDTFRFEEDKVLKAALTALQETDWNRAGDWAALRADSGSGSNSFWVRGDPNRQSAWKLVQSAVRFGQALARAGEKLFTGKSPLGGLDEALQAYVERGAAVDQAHRHLEQHRVTLLTPQVPEFETLRTCLDQTRQTWRTWADSWARDFNAVCRVHGFLPATGTQQRSIFDDVVRPLTREAGTTAYFVVDALRYEMAEELCRQFEATPATTLHLRARWAELPTVTAVGMNVLAPVAQSGRLAPILSADGSGVEAFQAGEFRVSERETRKRAMLDRVGGGTCPWLTLEEVVSRDSTSLKRSVAQARLVVVHSQEIDSVGEKGMGPAVFGNVIQKLRTAWQLLREAGVRRFVITADHGFLLLDDNAGSAQAHGRIVDPKRRHIFTKDAVDRAGEVRVALSDLGFEGVSGYLIFPETTTAFDVGRRSSNFVHGGNSLQERVIPVVTVVHRAAAGGSTLQYRVTAQAGEAVAGMHSLQARLEVVAQCSLDFGSPTDVELALRVPELDGVQIELCQTRGKARMQGGVVLASVGESFELFFRLSGPSEARVQVELFHPGAVAKVTPYVPDARFEVTALWARASTGATPPPPPVIAAADRWLEQLTEPGVRQVFAHLATHGVVSEDQAAEMLGGPRALRRFAFRFEEWARKAPFSVRIDVVAGVKRYVRQGRA